LINYAHIKQSITTRQAAESFGIPVNSRGMAVCPFHDDHNPSMKLNDTYYYCFACLEHGDVIDLVAQLHRESHYAAVQRLARDFGIGPNSPAPAAVKPRPSRRNPDEAFCRSVLTDYEQLLKRWKQDYAPAPADAPIDDRYVEACQMLPAVTDMIDTLFQSDAELRARVARQVVQDGTIPRLKERLDRLRKEGSDGSESPCAAA